MASYHVNIPIASKKLASVRFFHVFENNVSTRFLFIKNATARSIVPANVMLMEERIIEEIS
jgi:hypothetical protein